MTDDDDDWESDERVAEMRALILGERLPATLRAHRDARAMLVCVAQYWNDQADDEVHFLVFGSREGDPVWPPPDYDALDLLAGVYGRDVPAFQPFCHELGSQDDEPVDSYRPLAIAHRVDDGAIAVDRSGDLVRPWLDLPRTLAEPGRAVDPSVRPILAAAARDLAAIPVLADALVDRGDPRGEVISHGVAGVAPADPIARTWLGDLDRFVPRAGIAATHGLPYAVEVYAEAEQLDALDALDPDHDLWALLYRLRFGNRSARRVVPAFQRLGALGPLDDAALAQLAAIGAPFDDEELEVEPSSPAALDLLDPALTPKLRVLRVIGATATPALAAALRRLRGLDRIELVPERLDPADLAAWSTARLDVPLRLAQLDEDSRRPTGWSVELRGDRARIERIGRWRGATLEVRDAIRAALAGLRVEAP